MKTRKVVVEVICFVLMMFWFYEGIYKVAYWSNYEFWLKRAPLLRPIWQILAYVVPAGEIALAFMIIVSKYRKIALYCSIGGNIVFVLWVMSLYLFTHRLFWPYHALWNKPTWMQKMLVSLGLCWSSFTAILLLNSKFLLMNLNENSLRNKPTNAS